MSFRIPARRGLPLWVLLPLLLAAPLPGAQEAVAPGPEVDRILAEYDGPDTPGALVAVVEGGELVFQRAYGMADLTHGVPLTVESRTNIGSTAKQFTAFAVALLAEEGRLDLDEDVRAYLPELPDLGETVTLRHLLTHTSGYREVLNALAIGGWRLEDHISRREAVTVVQRQPELQNVPGTEWNYNNTGYVLLSLVVEEVTGEPFPDWMAAHVFEPLGMTRTVVRGDPRELVEGSARGYLPGEDAGEDPEFREVGDIGGAVGAGGIYTTLDDLARWTENLGTGELGGEAVMERMTTPYVLAAGDTTGYGLGLMLDEERGLRRIHHPGGDLAHRSHFAYYPDLDAGLIVLTNHGGFASDIPARIAEVFFGEHMEPREEAPEEVLLAGFEGDAYEPASFDVYAGRYELEIQPGFILTFWREEDRYFTRATGQPSVELAPLSDSTFALEGVDARITFHRDDEGRVTGLTLHQNGEHRARRLPDVEGDAVDLADFEGRYYSEEFETFYTVAAEDGALVMRHRRLDPVTLVHGTEDSFSGSFPLLQVAFERDGRGRVSGFRAGNGRARDIRFERVR